MLARSVTVIVSARVSPLREREINELFCGGRTLRRDQAPPEAACSLFVLSWEFTVQPLYSRFSNFQRNYICHFLENKASSTRSQASLLLMLWCIHERCSCTMALVTTTTMTSVFVQVLVDSPVLLTICSDTVWKELQMHQLRKCLLSQSDNNRSWRKKSRTK